MGPKSYRFQALPTLTASVGLAIGIALSLIPSSARSESWTTYRDSIYDCRLEYPNSLFTHEPLDLAEQAERFSGPNPRTYFRVMGVNNKDNLTPEAIRAKYLKSDIPGDIVYEHTRSDFLVLSGYRGDSIFYTKVALSADQRTICILEVTYPRAEKSRFDNTVTRMSRSFAVNN